MKASKLLISTLAGLLVMAGAGQAAHAQKQKKATFYVPRPERNFAQNLGGYSMDDYTLYDNKLDLNKKKNKHLIEEKVYHGYREAFDHLPVLPEPEDIDTEEKIVEFLDELRTLTQVVVISDTFEQFAKPLMKKLHWPMLMCKSRYLDFLNKKIGAFVTPLMKKAENTVSPYAVASDPGCADLVSYNNFYAERDVYNAMTPLRKQMCQEWFASACCKKIEQMDAPLIERAKAESPRRAPDWFIEGRKAEQAEVQAYNRHIVQAWVAKLRPFAEREKANIKKVIALYEEVDVIRGNDPMTKEYMGARLEAEKWVEGIFRRYYACLSIVSYTPLIKMPPTQEGTRKFVIQ